MAFSAADVVLIPFPYRDRLAERTRPAVVISSQNYNKRGDLVVAAITSHPARFDTDNALADWPAAGLKTSSTVRMLLATVAETRVVLHVGQLSDRDWSEVKVRIGRVFTWP
jgi:mRNA interferase MazF